MIFERTWIVFVLSCVCCGLAFSETTYPDGIYLSVESSSRTSSSRLATPSSLLGQVDYARRLADNRLVRFGLSFSLSVAPLANTITSHNLTVEDLEFLSPDPIRPYGSAERRWCPWP